jgi:hypothetical protein
MDIRQHKRQQTDLLMWVDVQKDIEGYEVRYVEAKRGRTVVQIQDPGWEIVGRSGKTETVICRMDQNLRLWQKARRVLQYRREQLVVEKSLDEVARFMSTWGPLIPPLRIAGREVFDERAALDPFGRINYLSGIVDEFSGSNDKDRRADQVKFISSMDDAAVAQARLEVKPAKKGSPFSLRMPTLLTFIEFEMLIALHAKPDSPRLCKYCGKPFKAGGSRGKSRRIDAKYCKNSCKNMASLAERV